MSETAIAARASGFSVLAGMLSFALTAWLAGRCLPPAELPSTVREKLAHLAAHGDDYAAVFVGSSRIQNHVMPRLFDRLAAERGLPVRSFNAGISSVHAPEDGWILDQILARKSPGLRWVFLEIDFFQTDMQSDESGTLRGVYWHDWPRFWLLCRRLLVMKRDSGFRDQIADFFERLRDFTEHLSAFGQHNTQLGRAALFMDRWLNRTGPEPMQWQKLGAGGDGWIAAIPPDHADKKRDARLASILRERMETAPHPDQADRVSQAALGEMIWKIRRAGAVPVLVIPPRAREYYFVPSPENSRRAVVLNFCDPARYPELFELRYRIDRSHLNAAGAEIFTRLLADRFLEFAHSEQSAPGAN